MASHQQGALLAKAWVNRRCSFSTPKKEMAQECRQSCQQFPFPCFPFFGTLCKNRRSKTNYSARRNTHTQANKQRKKKRSAKKRCSNIQRSQLYLSKNRKDGSDTKKKKVTTNWEAKKKKRQTAMRIGRKNGWGKKKLKCKFETPLQESSQTHAASIDVSKKKKSRKRHLFTRFLSIVALHLERRGGAALGPRGGTAEFPAVYSSACHPDSPRRDLDNNGH